MVKDCTRISFPVMLDMAPYSFLTKKGCGCAERCGNWCGLVGLGGKVAGSIHINSTVLLFFLFIFFSPLRFVIPHIFIFSYFHMFIFSKCIRHEQCEFPQDDVS
jgi:hypothetical protein